jgi:hypothetical protein
MDQARHLAEHGSPAAAVQALVKAKADRAVSKMSRATIDPKPAADRAERKTTLKEGREAFIAAVKQTNLTIPECARELKKIMEATGVNLRRDFGLTWRSFRAQRAERSVAKASW